MANYSPETNFKKTEKLAIEAEISVIVCKICKCTYFVRTFCELCRRKTTHIHERVCYICTLKCLFCEHQKSGVSQIRNNQVNLVYTPIIHF